MVKRKIVWDELAQTAFKDAFDYIKKDSPKQAEKVKNDIFEITRSLTDHPEKYPQDKYRKDKDSRFRAFEKYSYRISYFVAKDSIRILRFRHVKQEPKEY